MGKPIKVKLGKNASSTQEATKIIDNIYPNTDLYGFVREDGNVEVVSYNRDSQIATKGVGMISGEQMYDRMVKSALGRKDEGFEVNDEIRNAFWNYQYYNKLCELNQKDSPLSDKEKNWAMTYKTARATKECAILNQSRAGADRDSKVLQKSGKQH